MSVAEFFGCESLELLVAHDHEWKERDIAERQYGGFVVDAELDFARSLALSLERILNALPVSRLTKVAAMMP